MSETRCPSCGAPIGLSATECRYCGGARAIQPTQYQVPQSPQVPQYQPPQAPQYQAPPVYTPTGVPATNKSKNTAGILAIFLGGLGIHKFYLGKFGIGILYLVFCWTYIPAILGVIEGIIYLTSSDEKFYSKYDRH
jgi:TM2 domain-containing membrane protein YozV